MQGFMALLYGGEYTIPITLNVGAVGAQVRFEGVVNLSCSERVWADWRRGIRNRQAAVTVRQSSKN
jgi:hypothetical protein